MLRYRVPASTTNLAHGFDCLGMALGLFNTVAIEPGGSAVSAPGAADDGLARFASQVRELCASTWGVTLPGFAVTVAGEVPIARGLGSSSTIILGVAAACQELAGRPFDRLELIRLGAIIEGHPDNVAAAALGGFVVVGDIAGELRCQRFDPPAGLTCEVIIPDFEVKTAEARRVLPGTLSKADHVRGLQHTALIVAALARGDIDGLRGCFVDGWHEQHRAALNPHLTALRSSPHNHDPSVIGTFLSGSGSTVIRLRREPFSGGVRPDAGGMQRLA